MDPDPDPGGPKTCGSSGSGSATLVAVFQILLQIVLILVNLLQIVVILVGTNNHGDTPDRIAEGLKAICSLIREKLPKAFLILLVSISLLPGLPTADYFIERKNLSDS